MIVQSVPEAATRANLVERGDADLVVDLQASDVQSLEAKGKLKVISTPQYNAITYVSMNNQMPPFDNVNVRRAIAYALPYEDMFKAALFGRGAPLFGASWPDGKPLNGTYPFQQPVKLDLDKAREYLKAAGLPEGFSTTFSFNVGQAATAEPMAALVKESLGKIGIKVDIQKLPDAQMSTLINEKKVPFFTEGIVAWLPSMDYFYRNFYTGTFSKKGFPIYYECTGKINVAGLLSVTTFDNLVCIHLPLFGKHDQNFHHHHLLTTKTKYTTLSTFSLSSLSFSL